MKKQRKKKKSPQDLTNRNAKSYNRRLDAHIYYIKELGKEALKQRSFNSTLIDILKSKRLLTPAQVKMLEECLR
jgi:hypothetical protein